MKKPDVTLLNVVLALGMLLIAAGFVLILCSAGTNPGLSISLVPALMLLGGMVNLYVYIAFKKVPFKLFCGIDLCIFGVFSFIQVFFSLPFLFAQLWPIYIIFTAISLFIAGRTTGKRFSVNYDLIGIFLLCFGIVFFLFSFGIVKVSFSQISVYVFPALLILSGILLIVLFRRRKSILEILPEDVSKELNSGENSDDNEEDDSGIIL